MSRRVLVSAALDLGFNALHQGFRRSAFTPLEVIEEVLQRIDARGEDHVWVTLADRAALRAQASALADRIDEIDTLPLYGLPFGVKDNVDVAGLPTTCGCAGFERHPTRSATAVERAMKAGALCIGKQSLDQFATGLNGTRTVGGHCLNVFDPALIPGGSSSGSGVAVAARLVSFSLGSDTGGSGRVPAAMNHIVGLRPSLGLVSTRGMVFNNRLFDCIPVFALSVQDAFQVLDVIAGYDAEDPFSRSDADLRFDRVTQPARFRFAVPDQLEFFGDAESPRCFDQALQWLQALSGERCAFDFRPFISAGQLIFDSALVAERAASYGGVLRDAPRTLFPAVASILNRASDYTAAQAFEAVYRMHELRRHVARQFEGIDVLVTPTVARPFGVHEMLAEPITRNAEVGHYTYGVGPLDLCALALPAALRRDGAPFGISLVAPARGESLLRALGTAFETAAAQPPGMPSGRQSTS